MDETLRFVPPAITDDDILWASRLLGLSDDAFCGKDGGDPRQEVLKSMEPIDIAACPGSGKTTLLVAKLAVLAEKWQYRTRGICVLSHTNAARNEIEGKLGNTAAGRCLLSYPHFVGTIHAFVDQFLAIPWLRSRGYQVKIVDTEICQRRRWSKLAYGARSALEYKHLDESSFRIIDTNFRLARKNGEFPFSESKDTYKKLQKACQETALEGYHCYDDMFIWAGELMDKSPEVVNVIRSRFPLLFIDEAQDNSEEQSAILARIFMTGESTNIRQRLGDANQAIFNFVDDTGASTDVFPDESIRRVLPNSHRFGSRIAALAGPLALTQYAENCLEGHGPKRPLESGAPEGRHTIFLFDDNNIDRVLGAYAELLLDTFSEQELHEGSTKGLFVAVGQVHRDNKDDHRPRHVGHYWMGYDPRLTRTDPKPQTFVQYVFAGLGKSQTSGETYLAVEKIAEGILRLAGMMEVGASHYGRKHRHRHVLALLDGHESVREDYERLIARFVLDKGVLTKDTWKENWGDTVYHIAATIAGASSLSPEANGFLEWGDLLENPTVSPIAQKSRDNVFPFSKNGKGVSIRVGSIHSVKGETHMATLVLETYWQDNQGRHNLELLLPWLCRTKSGGRDKGVRQQSRLKIHFVAMTRPSHLLCLAMKRSCFEDGKGNLNQQTLVDLKECGWSDIRCL